MRPFIEELSRIAPIYISCYPNAGLPNAFGGFDETPETHGRRSAASSPRNGWLNIAGGCCGTTPEHIRAIAEAVRGVPPRVPPQAEPLLALQRPRTAGHPPRHQLREHRRAHQRHRLAAVSPS